MIVNYDRSIRYRVCLRRPAEDGFQSQYGTDNLAEAHDYMERMTVHPRWAGVEWRIESTVTKTYLDVTTQVIA